MDNEWAVYRICEALHDTVPGITAAQHADLQQRVRQVLRDWQNLGQTQAEAKHITILLADIRGFTAIAETYSAMLVVDMLNRYFSRMCQVIVAHDGTIDKFMGDSIMVLFGAPEARGDDVERAIACAVEMQLAMSDINAQNRAHDMPELFIGIGINSGVVVAGPLGGDLHSEYTVIGDEVNLASRIEAHSLRGQILISEATYRIARDYIEVGAPNRVQVKGKRDPVCLYELLKTHQPHELCVPRREERKSPRVEVDLPFSFRCLDGKIESEQQWQGNVLDISYHGLLAWVPIPLATLSEIHVRLHTGPLDADGKHSYARVVQSQQDGAGYRVSLEFSSMGEGALLAVKNFVDSMVYRG